MSATAKRWAAGAATAVVLGAVAFFATRPGGDRLSPGVESRGQAQPARAADWVMYGGTTARNLVNLTSKNLPAEWDVEKGENVKWAVDLGSKAYGGPIVSNGRVFVGTNNQKPRNPKDVDAKGQPIDLGIIMCFDEATGKFHWQTTFTKLASGRVNDWPLEGVCSTPCVEGDLLYYVNNRCEIICSKTTDGSIVWKVDMMKELGVFPHNIASGSPMIVGDDLYVVTSNGVDEGHINVPAPKAPSFVKVAKKDGKVLWTDASPTISLTNTPAGADEKEFVKRLVNRGQLIQHGQWSNPAYGVVDGQPQVVFPGGEGWIYAFDPSNGKLLWKFDCNPKDSVYELSGKGTRNDFIATPVIYKNRVYIGVGQDPEHESGVGHLYCIDMTKRGDVSDEIVESYEPKLVTKKNPKSAMVWHYGGATTPADRKKLGRNYYFGRTMSTCAIHEDICYIAELMGTVHALDANTGKVFWTHDTGAMTWSSTYWADGKIYQGNDDGLVTVFKHGKTKEILAEVAMPGRVRATPVAANGTLFVMTENKLYAIAEKK